VPRVVNLAVAVVLLVCLSPLVHLLDKPVWVRVLVVLFALPVVLVALAALVSAIRPGSLGRLGRRLRRRPAGR
jgi:hypothetical protein